MSKTMRTLLGATAIVALSAGAAYSDPSDRGGRNDHGSSTVPMSDPAQSGYGNGYNYGYDDGYARRERNDRFRPDSYNRGSAGGIIAVDLGGIAFGFRDGYWDNGHRWHRWHGSADYRRYRNQEGSHYRNRDHRHYDNDGWNQ
jgi:hypothetical protein